nr:DUF2806 domain-containing protein [Pontixanthobacter sp. CEM42]
MQAWLPSALRKQVNKEKIVEAAVEELESSHESNGNSDHGQAAAHEVEHDWLNMFERFAEDSSSEQFQRLWGSVLASEIRNPKSFSKRTLRFISELDRETATSCELLSKYLVGDFFPRNLVGDAQATDFYDNFIALEHTGLLTKGLNGVERTYQLGDDGTSIVPGKKIGLALTGPPGLTITFKTCVILSKSGHEIFSMLNIGDEKERFMQLACQLQGQRLHKVELVSIAPRSNGYWAVPIGTVNGLAL